MSYAVGEIRRWDAGGLTTASSAIAERESVVEDARRTLSDGREALDDGWDGVAADAVLDAADVEKVHVTKLADGLHDLADALARSAAALGPAVQVVRDRVADAEAAGLEVDDVSVRPAAGATDVEQSTVDQHARAIMDAIDTVISLDEHYGREIDMVAERIHSAIPAEVDRSPIPGPDDPWPGMGVDAVTTAMSKGFPVHADDIDPATRGAHRVSYPVPDELGRAAAPGLRGLGRIAGPVGIGLTVHGGLKDYAEGKATAPEAAVETAGAIGGGIAGGAAAGAAAGLVLGPVGVMIGAGVGAAVGSFLGKKGADEGYDFFVK